jgi:hypothetical protein
LAYFRLIFQTFNKKANQHHNNHIRKHIRVFGDQCWNSKCLVLHFEPERSRILPDKTSFQVDRLEDVLHKGTVIDRRDIERKKADFCNKLRDLLILHSCSFPDNYSPSNYILKVFDFLRLKMVWNQRDIYPKLDSNSIDHLRPCHTRILLGIHRLCQWYMTEKMD